MNNSAGIGAQGHHRCGGLFVLPAAGGCNLIPVYDEIEHSYHAVLGDNPVDLTGANSEAEVGGFIYGGNDDTDNSGSVTYLVIKGTGAQINEESQYNGVSLYAVGSATTLNNIVNKRFNIKVTMGFIKFKSIHWFPISA